MAGGIYWSHLFLIFVALTCHLPTALSLLNSSQPIRYRVLEKSIAGTFIGNVFENSSLAELYPDPKDQANLRFSIRSSEAYTSYFTINDTTGVLRTSTKLLNRDEICAYRSSCVLEFTVQILPPTYFQVFTVSVTVLDINDHTPTFTPNSIRLNISEADVPGKLFHLPEADDPDGGNDGIQTYRLQPNSTKFQLYVEMLADGSSDVRLRLMERLKRSEVSSYSLVVLAVDGGTPPKTGSLMVSITVLESTTPQQSLSFDNSSYDATVAENVSLGTVVLTVVASYQGTSASLPQPGQIVYSIDEGIQKTQTQFFGINNQTGDIYAASPLDHEKNPVLLLTVMAIDKNRMTSLPAYARLTIRVTDSNDNAPVITVATLTADGIAEVRDSALIDSFVAYIGVTDADDGVNGQVDCAINSTSFRLESVYTDYKMKTAIKFSRNSSPTLYAVSVTCTDRGSPRMTSLTVVLIRVIFTGPVFSNDRTLVDFYENNKVGDMIVAMNITSDPLAKDSRLSFDYSSLNDSSVNAIKITSTSGIVTANIVFQYDVRIQYSYVVTANDDRSLSSTATSTLIINILRRPMSVVSSSSSSPDSLVTQSPSSVVKDSTTVIITAVVCATVIVVVIVVVVAIAVVCYRRNQQKALTSAAAQLATRQNSVSSNGTKRLVRSISSVSSSIESTTGERRDSKLGSIQEEPFEDLQISPSDEWPASEPPYQNCGTTATAGVETSLIRSPIRRGLYVRSVSQTDGHHHRRSARTSGHSESTTEDAESTSCCSGSLTDSGRGNSLQDDMAPAVTGVSQQCPHTSSQIYRADSDSSGSSGRPLVPIAPKFPIENKIYITNHFRDALPRHNPRFQGGVRRDQSPGNGRTEANRSDYFDARLRAAHVTNAERCAPSCGPRYKSQPIADASSVPQKEYYDHNGSSVGEYTRSLYSGQDNLAYIHGSPRKQDVLTGEDCEDGVTMRDIPRRRVTPSGELNRHHDGGGYAQVSDTFV